MGSNHLQPGITTSLPERVAIKVSNNACNRLAPMGAVGAVACGHPVTAAAAIEILEEGGNAFDAAIAAQFAACVAEPVLTSLGGGGFLLASRAQSAARIFDFFAHTPRRKVGSMDSLMPIEAETAMVRTSMR